MRVAIGAMKHESNTFTHLSTDLEPFEPVTGDAVYDSAWSEGTATRGIIDILEAVGHEIVPTQFAHAIPSGVVTAAAFEVLRDGIVDRIERANPDAVCLDLHGSMAVEGESDPEGALLAAVRACVGQRPIVTSLDMHATVTDRMVEHLDGVAAYRTAPHTDVYDSGVRAGRILTTILDGTPTIVRHCHIPMLLSGEQSETDAEPMASLIGALETTDEAPGILETAYLLGFPWADSPHGGCFAVVTGEADAVDRVETETRSLAERFWARHADFTFTTEAYPLEAAVSHALDHPATPVVLSDSGDNPTAGATQDLAIVAEHLLERDVPDALVAVIVDPDAVTACRLAGHDVDVELSLGRTGPERDAPPLSVTGTVRSVQTVRGRSMAVVAVDGVRIVIADDRVSVTDPSLLEELGEDPAAYDLVAIKCGYQSPAYQAIAERSILALTPGATNCRLETLPYERVPRPIYPIDEPDWKPSL